MKAITLKTFGSVDNFQLEEVALPTNTYDNVLIRIKATSFNPIDYQMRQGSTESKLLKSSILGRELAGTIIEVGNNVTEFSVGDDVVAYVGSLGSNGTYTEFISVPKELIAIKPATISFEEATAVPMVGLTALQCVERLTPSLSQSIFISGGAGGVGVWVIKLLLAQGINDIVTIAGNQESIDSLLALGLQPDNIIHYKSPNFVQLIKNKHQSFDICIDLVGGKISELCSNILKTNGTYVDITALSTANAREELFDKGAIIFNISNYAYALSGKKEDLLYYSTKLTRLFELIGSRKELIPAIHNVGQLSLASVQLAHTILESNQTHGKKLVMSI